MELLTNSSNNTVYADSDGNIAYYHGNFIPRREPSFDWNAPLDGSNPATNWQGLHPLDELITVLNPPNGWIQNTNNTPFSAAGAYSPRPKKIIRPTWPIIPKIPGASTPSGCSKGSTGFTLDSLIEAAYDSLLTAFEPLVPALLDAAEAAPADDHGRTTRPARGLGLPLMASIRWRNHACGLLGPGADGQPSMPKRALPASTSTSTWQANASATQQLDALREACGRTRSPTGVPGRFPGAR